jgi:hypothetical protein
MSHCGAGCARRSRLTGSGLKVFATDGRSAGGKIDPATLRLTWQPQSVQDVNFAGLQRDSYGLGWDLGAYDGRRYVSRSGGYYGCRSFGLWVPELKFGVTVLSVGEVAVNTMNVAMIMQAVDLWAANSKAPERAATRIAAFHKAVASEAAKRQEADPRLTNPAPFSSDIAAAAAGTYRNERLGHAVISPEGGRLFLATGVNKADLIPVAGTELLYFGHASLDSMPLKFSGSSGGKYDSFVLDDDRFERVH